MGPQIIGSEGNHSPPLWLCIIRCIHIKNDIQIVQNIQQNQKGPNNRQLGDTVSTIFFFCLFIIMCRAKMAICKMSNWAYPHIHVDGQMMQVVSLGQQWIDKEKSQAALQIVIDCCL